MNWMIAQGIRVMAIKPEVLPAGGSPAIGAVIADIARLVKPLAHPSAQEFAAHGGAEFIGLNTAKPPRRCPKGTSCPAERATG